MASSRNKNLLTPLISAVIAGLCLTFILASILTIYSFTRSISIDFPLIVETISTSESFSFQIGSLFPLGLLIVIVAVFPLTRRLSRWVYAGSDE